MRWNTYKKRKLAIGTLTPVREKLGFCSTSDVIIFYQNWITCTQALQEETTFPMIPMAWWEWLGQLSLRYARKWSEIGVKTRSKISLAYTWIFRLAAFSKILELEASREDQQPCSKKIRTGWKRVVKKKKRRRSFPRPKPFEILITVPSQKEIS